MLLINFAHPIPDAQRAKVEELTSQKVEHILDVRTQFDPARSFVDQSQEVIDQVGLSPAEWQTVPLLISPPALSVIAAVVLAEIHGRSGYFPPILRLRLVAGSLPPVYEVAEILNLQQVRDAARARR